MKILHHHNFSRTFFIQLIKAHTFTQQTQINRRGIMYLKYPIMYSVSPPAGYCPLSFLPSNW
jgi:hypothetical protein